MVLEGEHAADAVFEMIGPEIGRRHAIHQLHVDAHLRTFAPDAAFEHVPHAQFSCHLSHIHIAAFVDEDGIARDDRKRNGNAPER